MSAIPDLMRQIDALRVEQFKNPQRADEIRAARAVLRQQLREQRDREHGSDMQLAAGLASGFGRPAGPAQFRQHHKPAPVRSWVTPALCTVVVIGVLTLLALQFFGVLRP